MNRDLRSIAGINRVIHEPARLIIMAILYAIDRADFLYLLRETGLTRGNLSAHLTRLEEAGYITIEKRFRGKIPQTICRLTDEGRHAFRQYRGDLKRAIENIQE